MNKSLWFWIALLISGQFCAAQTHAVKVAPNGETTLSAVLGTKRVEVGFRTATVQISLGKMGKNKFVQCTYSRVPCSLTEQIRLQVGGNDVFIPRSAYADLGDISTAQLTTHADLVTLTIHGGDASESYIAELIFNKQRLLERKIYSGEDPNDPLEISHFYVVSLDD